MMMTMDALPPEALLDDFPPPMQALAQRLRSIVVATEPTVVERVRAGWRLIGYDLPIGRRNVYFAWISPEVAHVHLGFPVGWAMRDPLGELQGAGITKRARWLTFRAGDRIDEDTVWRAGARSGDGRRHGPRRARASLDGSRGRRALGAPRPFGRWIRALIPGRPSSDAGDSVHARLGSARMDDPLEHRPSSAA